MFCNVNKKNPSNFSRAGLSSAVQTNSILLHKLFYNLFQTLHGRIEPWAGARSRYLIDDLVFGFVLVLVSRCGTLGSVMNSKQIFATLLFQARQVQGASRRISNLGSEGSCNDSHRCLQSVHNQRPLFTHANLFLYFFDFHGLRCYETFSLFYVFDSCASAYRLDACSIRSQHDRMSVAL